MSCRISEEESRICLVFDTEEACNDALAIQNAPCAGCKEDCGLAKSVWAEKDQRADGKWWFFKNPKAMVGIDGVISKSEVSFSKETFDKTSDIVQVIPK